MPELLQKTDWPHLDARDRIHRRGFFPNVIAYDTEGML